MLDDRQYMRAPEFRSGHDVIKFLLITNIAVFVIQSLLAFYGGIYLDDLFALSPEGLMRGFVWQFITFQFMHGGLWHLLFNMLAIWFFGRALEQMFGSASLLKLYLVGGVAGGVAQVTLGFIIPQYFGGPMVGASAGAFAIVAAYATLFPDRVITFLLFFILPVSLRAKTLLWLATGLAVFGILVPTDNVADAAHLGGIVFGLLFVKKVWWQNPPTWLTLNWLPKIKMKSTGRRSANPGSKGRVKPVRITREKRDTKPVTDFMTSEVDPILEKISAHGIQSLTDHEREILEKAQKQMSKR